jgi:L-threonylcarbamoyladenylate synthase
MNDVAEATDVIRRGDLVVYPTDTLYGLGADVFNERAVERVYRIKRRPHGMPLPVAVGSVDDIESVAVMNDTAWALARALLPGALTLVLSKRDTISEQVAGDTIAVRVPDHHVAMELCRHAGPISATSANLHGQMAPSTVGKAREQLGDAVDLYLDGGELPGVPSTVAAITPEGVTVIREGAVSEERLHDIIH